MKKLLVSILTSALFSVPAFAVNIDVLPTMQSKTNVQDRVWVGTFQIVWNDFMNRVAFNQIKFPEGTPQIANELNKQEFTTEELSGRCYYKYAGAVKKNTKKRIERAIKRKFKETSDLLSSFDLSPAKDKIFIYAMLKKDFKFKSEFDKLGTSDFRGIPAEFFGITSASTDKLRNNVEVLFYTGADDLAVKLDTQGRDEVYLYKTSTTKPFNYIYADLLKKQKNFNGNQEFGKEDILKVPVLRFYEEKNFDDLCGKRVKGTNLVVDKAMETVKFDMDNTGVQLKSEAGMMVTFTSLAPSDEPRFFEFDDTFVVFLKEKGKNKPYFALRVHNIENFQ